VAPHTQREGNEKHTAKVKGGHSQILKRGGLQLGRQMISHQPQWRKRELKKDEGVPKRSLQPTTRHRREKKAHCLLYKKGSAS